ncbi:hypothetical protein [Rhodococcus sp. NPDC047139]|uniref:hypothetical protein n=1 Tax=Rhodococcus sp. NPDC047139 TaxID=3155141 RepID=UPI0033FF6883
MRDDHDALLSELLLLADVVLDRVEDAVQQFVAAPGGAAAHSSGENESDRGGAVAANGCAWCPLCAAAALVRGENHELITRLATKLAALIALLREFLSQYLPSARDGGDPPEPSPDPPARQRPAFVPISVDVRT